MIKCQVLLNESLCLLVSFHHSIPFHSCIFSKERKSSSVVFMCIQDGAFLRPKYISLEVTTSSPLNCFLEVTENRGKCVWMPRRENAGRLCNSRKPPCYLSNTSSEIPRATWSWMDCKKAEGFTKLYKLTDRWFGERGPIFNEDMKIWKMASRLQMLLIYVIIWFWESVPWSGKVPLGPWRQPFDMLLFWWP